MDPYSPGFPCGTASKYNSADLGTLRGTNGTTNSQTTYQQIQGLQCGAYVGAVEEMLCVVYLSVTKRAQLSHLYLEGLWIWIPPLSPGGRRTYDLCGTCKRTMDNEVPGIMY